MYPGTKGSPSPARPRTPFSEQRFVSGLNFQVFHSEKQLYFQSSMNIRPKPPVFPQSCTFINVGVLHHKIPGKALLHLRDQPFGTPQIILQLSVFLDHSGRRQAYHPILHSGSRAWPVFLYSFSSLVKIYLQAPFSLVLRFICSYILPESHLKSFFKD